jgi:branched-chain amino acid transport system substrate-binding protein
MRKLIVVALVVGLGFAFSGVKAVQSKPAVVKIGAIYPLTGGSGQTGKGMRQAVLLAEEIINGEYPDVPILLAKTAGLPNLGGAKVKFIIADSASKPEVGRAEAERLITQEKVVALIGSFNSSVTSAASAVAERYKIPFYGGSSSSPKLIERGYHWYFHSSPLDTTVNKVFLDFVDTVNGEFKANIKRIAVLYPNALFGETNAEVLKWMLPKRGYEKAAFVQFTEAQPNFDAEVLSIKQSNPDLLIEVAKISDAIQITKARDRFGLDVPVIGNGAAYTSVAFLKAVGDLANNIFMKGLFPVQLTETKETAGKVNSLFREKYGQNLDDASSRSFTSADVIAFTINEAGLTKPEAIRQALLNLDIPGEALVLPWGGVKFDPKTQLNEKLGMAMFQIQAGKFEVVYPLEFASNKIGWIWGSK